MTYGLNTPTGVDPYTWGSLGDLWEAASMTRNSYQAPWISLDYDTGPDAAALAAKGDDEAQATTAGLPSLYGQAWGELLTARVFVDEARHLFDEARTTPEPQEGQLVKQGNADLAKAKPLADAAVAAWYTLEAFVIDHATRPKPRPPSSPPVTPPPVTTLPPGYPPGAPGHPGPAPKPAPSKTTGLRINGSAADIKTFNDIIDDAARQSPSFRKLIAQIRKRTSQPVQVVLVNGPHGGVFDNFAGRRVFLSDILQLPRSTKHGSDEITRGQVLSHFLEERFAAPSGAGNVMPPAAHAAGIQQENLYRQDLGQSPITNQFFHAASNTYTIFFADGNEEQIHFDAAMNMTSIRFLF